MKSMNATEAAAQCFLRIHSSMRTYYENAHASSPLKAGQHIDVPAGFALFPKEIYVPPRE